MVKAADERHSAQPLLFQCPVEALGDCNASMLADCTETLLDAKWLEKTSQRGAVAAALLVRNQMFGWADQPEGLPKSLADTISARTMERLDADQLAREMVDGDSHVYRPEAVSA